MSVTLRPITAENWRECVALAPHPEQEGFVAPNVLSLAESKFDPRMQTYGIYAGEAMVGFACYGRDPETGGDWIIRLMVDRDQQGKGYATAAMRVVLDRLLAAPDCREIALDYAPENEAARRLYAKFGFREKAGDPSHRTVLATLDAATARTQRDATPDSAG